MRATSKTPRIHAAVFAVLCAVLFTAVQACSNPTSPAAETPAATPTEPSPSPESSDIVPVLDPSAVAGAAQASSRLLYSAGGDTDIFYLNWTQLSPILLKWKSSSAAVQTGDTTNATFNGIPLKVTAARTDNGLSWNVTATESGDTQPSMRITISWNRTANTFDYHQVSYFLMSGNQWKRFIIIDLKNIALGSDLSFQGKCKLIVYWENTESGYTAPPQLIAKADNVEFYSSPTVQGFAGINMGKAIMSSPDRTSLSGTFPSWLSDNQPWSLDLESKVTALADSVDTSPSAITMPDGLALWLKDGSCMKDAMSFNIWQKSSSSYMLGGSVSTYDLNGDGSLTVDDLKAAIPWGGKSLL